MPELTPEGAAEAYRYAMEKLLEENADLQGRLDLLEAEVRRLQGSIADAYTAGFEHGQSNLAVRHDDDTRIS